MIIPRPWASLSAVHLTFVFAIILTDVLKVLSDGPLVVTHFYRLEAISGEKGLSWSVELSFKSITSRTDTVLGSIDWPNQVRRSQSS